MTPKTAKEIIKSLNLSYGEFSELMGKNKNYVTDFNRYGVPQNIQIILTLSQELLSKGGNPTAIIKKITNQGKTLDKEKE
ncbi:MAG: hypothetical protein A3F91_09590 [Flavobacteria bacterium RIFCSPLOWO2_12_FULL_35_11]|nr:MAG: hypothetical protein A3F91_09590 [Flavobacteria bacterium RIFCSPLOWO2_12_FULL_35_11]